MWSAISSYLGESAPPAPPTTPRRLPPTTPRKLSTVMTLSAEKRAHDAPMGADNSSSTNNKSSQKAEEVIILRGIIVGTAQSGKTSLLRRLRGEDITDGETRKLMALLPWKIPNDALGSILQVDQEVVQLYLSEAASFSSQDPTNQSVDERKTAMCKEWRDRIHQATRKHARKQVDFIVWMVDARQDADSVVEFVQLGLECLYPSSHVNTDQNEAAADKKTSVQSLCILLNFRDLQKDNQSLLQQIRDVADKVISQHKTNGKSTAMQTSSILVYEASMLTNYGIQSLQSFITLPYLMYKENEYQRRIREVRKGYESVKRGLMTSNDTSYGDYIKQNAAAAKQQVTTPKRSQTSPRKYFNSPLSNKIRSDSLELSRSIDKQLEEVIPDGSGKPRQLFPTQRLSQPPWTPLDGTSQNLDYFFSDDESDQENELTAPQDLASRKATNVVLDSDGDSNSDNENDAESDDEFYIDNTGQRHDHSEKLDESKPQTAADLSEEKKEYDKPSNMEDTILEATEDSKENSDAEQDQVDANDLNASATPQEKNDAPTDAVALENSDEDESSSVEETKNEHDEIQMLTNDEVKKEYVNGVNENKSPSNDCVEPALGDSSRVLDKSTLDDESETSLKRDDISSDNAMQKANRDSDENTNDTLSSQVHPECKEEARSQMVLESDDESSTVNVQNKVLLDSDDESIDNVQTKVKSKQTNDRDTHKEVIPKAEKLTPSQSAPITTKKAEPEIESKPVSTVSNAALAAIEAARLEAERALGGSTTATKSKEKKSKKEKKKSKDKSKKSKKKDGKVPEI